MEKPDAFTPTTSASDAGKEGAGQVPQVASPLPSQAGEQVEKPEAKGGRLDDEDKQTIYGLLHKGESQQFVLKLYGAGKNDTLGKMAEELKTGKVVYHEGRWMDVEELEKHDTTKAGESAAKVAATAETAVEPRAQIVELGKYVKEECGGIPPNNGYAIP